MIKSLQVMVVAFVVCLLGATPAQADPGSVNLFGRLEPSFSIPLNAPQTERFYPGFQGSGNFGIGFRWIDFKVTALVLVLPAKDTLPATDTSASVGLGGGFRLKLPYDRYRFSPWVDFDALYVHSTSLDRPAFSVAVGLYIPVDPRSALRIGPVVRYTQIISSDQTDFDDRDARMLSLGFSIEFGQPIAAQ